MRTAGDEAHPQQADDVAVPRFADGHRRGQAEGVASFLSSDPHPPGGLVFIQVVAQFPHGCVGPASPHPGQVFLDRRFAFPTGQGVGQAAHGGVALARQQQPRGIFVQAVDQRGYEVRVGIGASQP